MRSFVVFGAVLASTACGPTKPLYECSCIAGEHEPNNDEADATPTFGLIAGSIAPAGDVDDFVFAPLSYMATPRAGAVLRVRYESAANVQPAVTLAGESDRVAPASFTPQDHETATFDVVMLATAPIIDVRATNPDETIEGYSLGLEVLSDAVPAPSLALPSHQHLSLENAGAILSRRISLSSPAALHIDAVADDDLVLALRVIDAQGNMLARGDAELDANLPRGEMTLVVENDNAEAHNLGFTLRARKSEPRR